MDLSSMSYWELNKLYIQIGIELFQRSWWLVPLVIVIFFMIGKFLKR